MLVFLIIVGYLLFNYFVAQIFHQAALDKGYDESRFFWIPFLFGFLGQLAVVALPNKKDTALLDKLCKAMSNPALTAQTGTSDNQRTPAKPLAPIVCPKCNTAQNGDRKICWQCGYRLSQE